MLSKIPFLATLAVLATAQTPANCTVTYSGALGLRHASDYAHGPITLTSTIPGIHALGPDSHADSILVTHYKNGTAVPSSAWEFLNCPSLASHGYPPGYSPPTTGPVNLAYGILRPAGKTEECLSLVPTGKGAKRDRLVVARECGKVRDTQRGFMIENYIYGESSYGMRLFYLQADDVAVVGNTTHGEVELVARGKNGEAEAKQLLLLQEY